MRLLLLLSALLGALTGVVGGHASAQPVAASVAAVIAAPRVASVRAAPDGVLIAALPGRRDTLVGPAIVEVAIARPRYVERRRE